MDQGKRICKILKELRKRIADANGLQFTIEDCPHKGPCPGTCPRCEQELEDLFDQLHWLEQEGRKLKMKDLMTDEELHMFYAGGPSQIPEADEKLASMESLQPNEILGDIRPYFGNIMFHRMVFAKLLSINENNNNLVFSPIGVQTALEILQHGMRKGSKIYKDVQEFPMNDNSSLSMSLTPDVALEQATSLWVDRKKGKVKDAYIKKIEKDFNAAVFNRDFADAEAVKTELDHWVSEHTHEAIKTLDMQLSPYAFMVLLDAIYMKAKWEHPFDESDTKIRQFTNADGTKAKVRMMHKTLRATAYEETPYYKSICLPYKDSYHSMVIVLPRQSDVFDMVINSNDWMSPQKRDCEVELSLPKFKFDVKVDMVETLKRLGLEAMFDREDSFPKISDEPVLVSQFFQQCTIAVDEEGTEAAAATVVEWEVGCLPPDEPAKTYRMNVNRPFGFVVKYDDGMIERIIFAGVVKSLDDADETPESTRSKRRLSSITVAGTSFIDNIDEMSECMDVGTELRLEHDKANKHDIYAVALYLGEDRVGYVPKGENEIIANLLDAGTRLVATITDMDWHGNWLRIKADIDLLCAKPCDLTCSIEPATAEDVPAIAQFQLDLALETEELILDRETVLRGVSETLTDTNKGSCLVARTDKGEVVASLMITKEWSDWYCGWHWWIQSVYVKPEYRRQGIFRKLYAKVKEMAIEAGAISLRLYMDKTNARAKAAYHGLGMRNSHHEIYEEPLK